MLSCFMVALFCLVYVLVHYKVLWKNKNWKTILLLAIFILLCSSLFLLPLLEYKNATLYEVLVPGRMERGEVLVENKLSFYRLFYTPKAETLVFEIGFVPLIGMLLTPLVWSKKLITKEQKRTYLFFTIAGILSCLVTLKIFPFEKLPAVFKMLQFPWRMLEIATFFFSVIAGINFYLIIKDFGWKDILVLLLSQTVLTGIVILPRLQYEEWDIANYIPAVPLTASTGRVHAGMASMEYMPSKAFQNRSYLETRDQKVHILSGEGLIQEEQKENTNLSFLCSAKQGILLELPYLFYPGYTVQIETEEGMYYPNLYETEHGMLGVEILKDLENAKVQVAFTGTNIMVASYILTGIGLLVTVGYYIWYVKSLQKRNSNQN